jgi:O-antigen/teichoic acid export membrane protein
MFGQRLTRVMHDLTVSANSGAQTGGLGLGRNTLWMFIGQCGYAAGQWAILILLARLDGPVLVGQFTLAMAIIGPIVVFSQVREIQAVDPNARYAFADYRAVRLYTTAFALVVILLVAAFAGYPVAVAAVICAVGLTRTIESLSDIYYGLAQRHERLDRVAQSMLLRTMLGCVVLGIVLLVTGSLVTALLAQAFAWTVVWWLFDRRVARSWQDNPDAPGHITSNTWRVRLQLAWVGLPLGGAVMLGTLNANVPRYVVEGSLGLEALGIFAALAQFIVVGNTVIMAVCDAAIPRLANLFAAGRTAAFRRLLLQLCSIGAGLGLAGVLVAFFIGEPLLYLVYGEAFSAQSRLLVWIMVVGAIWYTIAPLGSSLSAMHRFRVQPVIQGCAVGVNTVACLLLVPRYGLDGAVGGWVAALVCQAFVSLALVAVYLRRYAAKADAPSGLDSRHPPERVAARTRRSFDLKSSFRFGARPALGGTD